MPSVPSCNKFISLCVHRARLVASTADKQDVSSGRGTSSGAWAHSIPLPEQGCLLVAHPLMFSEQQTYFYQSCIFLFHHDERGSAGIVLTRPSQHTLGTVAGAEMLCPEFEDSILHLGGDVGNDTLHVLHGVPGLKVQHFISSTGLLSPHSNHTTRH